jgi:ketosteroid isomerase-like protein
MSTLKEAFDALTRALAIGDLARFYGLIRPDAVIMDEDLPFRVDRAGFEDHIAFHGPLNWEGFAWKPHDIRFVENGATGLVAGFAMFRGKPKDSGFRLRPMMFSQGWSCGSEGWRITTWHQSPVVGHVSVPSPG